MRCPILVNKYMIIKVKGSLSPLSVRYNIYQTAVLKQDYMILYHYMTVHIKSLSFTVAIKITRTVLTQPA